MAGFRPASPAARWPLDSVPPVTFALVCRPRFHEEVGSGQQAARFHGRTIVGMIEESPPSRHADEARPRRLEGNRPTRHGVTPSPHQRREELGGPQRPTGRAVGFRRSVVPLVGSTWTPATVQPRLAIVRSGSYRGVAQSGLQPAHRRRRDTSQSGDLSHTLAGGQFMLGPHHLGLGNWRAAKSDDATHGCLTT
jgi:hypothetical protein